MGKYHITLKKNKNYYYMFFVGWEVHKVKNCDQGLQNAAQGCRPRAAFQDYIQVLKGKKNTRKKSHTSITVTMVRDRKIQTKNQSDCRIR